MRTLFKNPEHQAFFEENGYIKLPWLEPAEAAFLRDTYYRLKALKPDGFFATYAIPDEAFRREVKSAISDVFQSKLERFFVDVEPKLVSFITKTKGDPSKDYILAHQDWTFVDEEAGFSSLTVWCPLEPTHQANGNLGFVPRSNRLKRYPRQSEDCTNPYLAHYDMLRPYEVYVPTELGEALFFDNATFHFSSKNTTDTDRLVAGMMIAERGATMAMYYENVDDPGLLDKYCPDTEYFLQKPFGVRPDRFVATLPKPLIADPMREILAVYPDAPVPQEPPMEEEPVAKQEPVQIAPRTVWQRVKGLFAG